MKTFDKKSSSKETPTSTAKILSAFLTRHPLIQPKLKIGQPNDKYEQEADRTANQVMRMTEPGCLDCDESDPADQYRRISFYPGNPIDPAEYLLGDTAKHREREKGIKAFPITSLPDLFKKLENIAEIIKNQTGQTSISPFITELYIYGHGNPGEYGIGDYLYNADHLLEFKVGSAQKYLKTNAVIYLEGCNVAAGIKGMVFLHRLGMLFYGSGVGFFHANTCPIMALQGIDLSNCNPIKVKYPDDLVPGSRKKKNNPE